MRGFHSLWLFLFLLCPALPAEQTAGDHDALAKLAQQAGRANPKDQCYLYAKLVRGGVELADHDVADGDVSGAETELHDVSSYADALNASVDLHTKKLQDAEILLRESAFRLHSAMMGASIEDRPAMAQALKDVNAAEKAVMAEVFRR